MKINDIFKHRYKIVGNRLLAIDSGGATRSVTNWMGEDLLKTFGVVDCLYIDSENTLTFYDKKGFREPSEDEQLFFEVNFYEN